MWRNTEIFQLVLTNLRGFTDELRIQVQISNWRISESDELRTDEFRGLGVFTRAYIHAAVRQSLCYSLSRTWHLGLNKRVLTGATKLTNNRLKWSCLAAWKHTCFTLKSLHEYMFNPMRPGEFLPNCLQCRAIENRVNFCPTASNAGP